MKKPHLIWAFRRSSRCDRCTARLIPTKSQHTAVLFGVLASFVLAFLVVFETCKLGVIHKFDLLVRGTIADDANCPLFAVPTPEEHQMYVPLSHRGQLPERMLLICIVPAFFADSISPNRLTRGKPSRVRGRQQTRVMINLS